MSDDRSILCLLTLPLRCFLLFLVVVLLVPFLTHYCNYDCCSSRTLPVLLFVRCSDACSPGLVPAESPAEHAVPGSFPRLVVIFNAPSRRHRRRVIGCLRCYCLMLPLVFYVAGGNEWQPAGTLSFALR